MNWGVAVEIAYGRNGEPFRRREAKIEISRVTAVDHLPGDQRAARRPRSRTRRRQIAP
jgi:hypothetical protein